MDHVGGKVAHGVCVHGWSGICLLIKICTSIDIKALEWFSALSFQWSGVHWKIPLTQSACSKHISIHRYTLRHVSRNTSCLAQKIILHVKIRYGFRTFQNVSKMRAMTQDTANQVIKVTMLEICHYEKSKKWFCRVYVDNYTKKDPFNEGFKIAIGNFLELL